MRTIHRNIVGGFIFSKDGKLLLGKNRKGGVYEGMYVIPGGGVDEGETREAALEREIMEETGLDIGGMKITELPRSSGEHEKTLAENGERVLVKMNFYNYRIDLTQRSEAVIVVAGDDWCQPRWFTMRELNETQLTESTKNLLQSMIIAQN
jgi:8-oxo-dGTP pyrophosphatase MutT (NUDIX family)